MSDHQHDPDRPEPATEGMPYAANFGSLLGRPLETSDLIDALEVAAPAEREEVLRQLERSRQWYEERLYRLEQERNHLLALHPWLADGENG